MGTLTFPKRFSILFAKDGSFPMIAIPYVYITAQNSPNLGSQTVNLVFFLLFFAS